MTSVSSSIVGIDPHTPNYQDLVEAVARGAVLFVGAGSSRVIGYPTWEQLLAVLERAAQRLNEAAVRRVRGDNGLLRASTYKEVLGAVEYHRILCETFAPRVPGHASVHETLVSIPFRHVLTTNYDEVLLSAHKVVFGTDAVSFDADEWDKLSELRQQDSPTGADRRYVHVHGSVRRPDGIVLCREDYDHRYFQRKDYSEFLRQLLAGQRLVFVGFGLGDEDFKHVLRESVATLRLRGPRHFALLPAPSDSDVARTQADDLRGLNGIATVYFDNTSGDFSGMWALVEQLRQDVDECAPQFRSLSLRDIANLFPDDPAIQEKVVQRASKAAGVRGAAVSLSDAGGGNASDVDREIDAVFALVASGQPDEAIAQYEAIRVRVGSALSAKHLFRLDANIGNALYSKGDVEGASRSYLRAVDHFRDSRNAKGIELLGHFLGGSVDTSRRLAAELCASEPSFGRAWSIWVRVHEDAPFVAIEAAVPVLMRADPEVAQALAERAARCDDLDAHVRYARDAVAAAPDWVDALSMLGAAIVTSERRFATFHADRGVVPRHADTLVEAENAITKAIDGIGSRDPAGRLAGQYFNRSVARRLLGRIAEATHDLREAFRLSPSEPVIALGFAMEAEAESDVEAAISALSELPRDADWAEQAQLAFVMLLLRRRGEGDLEEARGRSERLCARLGDMQPPTHRWDVVKMALRVCQELGRAEDGPSIVARLPDGVLPEHLRLGLLARAHLQAGERGDAVATAKQAVHATSESAPWFDRREAALLAQDCGLHSEAVRLWRSILAPDEAGSDTVHLVRAAFFAAEWRVVLDVCAAVRAAGRTTWRHLMFEVEVLAASREVPRAITLLSDWIGTHPRDRRAVLHRSALALRDGQQELAEFDETRLPSVAEVRSPGEGGALVFVIRRGPRPARALDVAYALFRRFPDDHEAHRALVACVFDPSASQLTIERPTRVGAGAAVHVRRLDGPPRWVYVESEANPVASRDEYSSTHEFVRAMWGLAAGEEFEYAGHRYQVVGVDSRILRRAHDIMERYEENFPEKPAFRRFSAPQSPSPDAPVEEQLGEIYGVLKRDDERRQLLESEYRKNLLPIATFASLLGRRVFELVRYLASDRTMGVRADDGNADRWMNALAMVGDGTELVVDGTVLAGALTLGHLSDLADLGVKITVPQAVVDELRAMSLEAGGSSSPRATVGLHKGRVFFFEPSPEEVATEVARIESVISFIGSHCEIVGGEAALDLPREMRERLAEYLDVTSMDAVAIAISRNAVLWTDDLGLQRVLTELGATNRSVWTQVVFRSALDRSRITPIAYANVLARLIDHGYVFTRFTAEEAVGLLRSVDWKAERGMGEALVRVICESALTNPHNALITGMIFKRVWTDCPRTDRAKAIITSVLARTGGRLARWLYRFPGVRVSAVDRRAWVAGSTGTTRGLGAVARMDVNWHPFKDPAGRALKRFLRSWRSRDGECKPERSGVQVFRSRRDRPAGR
ncbi:MAG: SIR2 family protein [Phycisphaerales bacterium]|nr:SIR2 family protein [Phycisphaerales bacterium]